MAVNIQDIQKLRDSTGVSMMVCKKALEESDGDMDKAFDLLRKKGESKVAERSERSTNNGAISIKKKDGKAVLFALLCETDFVARSDDFLALLEDLTNKAMEGKILSESDELDEIKDAQLKMGEKIQVGKVSFIEAPMIGSYVHTNNKIGAIVGLKGGDDEVGADLAMHATALNPKYLKATDVDSSLIEKEREIWKEQLVKEGKNDEIIEKIMIGKEKKFREENAFESQVFVKDPDMTISSLLSSKNAEIVDFFVFSI